jgi:hypothetical protein
MKGNGRGGRTAAVAIACLMGLSIAVATAGTSSHGVVDRSASQIQDLGTRSEASNGGPKVVKKVVTKAVTTLRRVPKIVSNPPQVPAGQIRPCTEGRFFVDFEQWIVENPLNQFLGLVGGSAPHTPADNAAGFVVPTFSQLIGLTDETVEIGSSSIEALLRSLVRVQLISLMLDEARDCPEFVERVVTTVITQLRAEEPKEPSEN